MTNEPQTRHLLVTLPDTYGEHSDLMAEALERFATNPTHGGPWVPGATVEHLTPETLPDRYVERVYAPPVPQALFATTEEDRPVIVCPSCFTTVVETAIVVEWNIQLADEGEENVVYLLPDDGSGSDQEANGMFCRDCGSTLAYPEGWSTNDIEVEYV